MDTLRRERAIPRNRKRRGKDKLKQNLTNNSKNKQKQGRPQDNNCHRTRCRSRHGLRMQLDTLPRGLSPPSYYIWAIATSIPPSLRPYPQGQQERGREMDNRERETRSRKQKHTKTKRKTSGKYTKRTRCCTRSEGN